MKLSKKIPKKIWANKQRRSFLLFGAGFFGSLFAGRWLWTRSLDNELPWPFRRALQWNERTWRALFSKQRAGENPPAPPVGTPLRVNGRIGLNEDGDFDDSPWQLEVEGHRLDINDFLRLPQTESTALFKCIEGWSQVISYSGVRFSDFLKAYNLGHKDGVPYDYVYLETTDGEYYGSIDMESMLHSKTILAVAMNGRPLSSQNGAPLRLVIPVKYGIKNIKSIGRIAFSQTRPPDYWTERGYDWYAGL
jgi:DMSO/TMAO reductase YedYZ molybdopterin-dependent catalytic subunit